MLCCLENLIEASQKGDVAEVQRLILAGADLDATDDRLNTPLINAAAFGHLNVTR